MAPKATAQETISTSQIINEIAQGHDELPKKMVKEITQYFLAVIENEVIRSNKVRIDKIGILQVKDRAARKGRNPQTGEEIQIPASKKIAFRPAKSLKEQVSEMASKGKKKKK